MQERTATYQELLEEGENMFRKAQIPDAALDSWLLFEYVSGLDRSQYFLRRNEEAGTDRVSRFREMARKRAEHIPLQYLTGGQEFMGLFFQVNEHVLVPRQDTECLAETALSYVEGKRVLDLCTGSGCLAISLKILGNAKKCIATDLSEKALEVARKNAEVNQADVLFLQSDLFEKITGRFDVIVSNPPYIAADEMEGLPEEVRGHEPQMALYGGTDGLSFYRRITGEARKHLQPGGYLFYEIGCRQAQAVMAIMEAEGFAGVACKKDYAGNDRVVCGKNVLV